MEDYLIMELFLNRDLTAIEQAERLYGDACFTVAERTLGDSRIAQTAVREALLRAWDSIPPKKPKYLDLYLFCLTRNLAVDHAPQNGEYDRALRELERCIPRQTDDLSAALSTKELRRAMDEFLGRLARDKRRMFILRYWYLCSAEEISRSCGGSPDQVRKVLNQTRARLRDYLQNQELPGLSAVLFLREFGNIRDQWILEGTDVKPHPPLWLKGAVIGAAVCCAVALGALLVSRQTSPEETKPPQTSMEAPLPSDTAPPVSTTEPEPSTEESTASPIEPTQTTSTVTAPPVTEPSIQDSAAYQKLLALPNAEVFLCNEFGYNYLEIFAEWIESQEGLMETYPDEWHLKKYADGAAGLTCHSPLAEDNSRHYYYIQILDYDWLFPYPETDSRYFTDIPREAIAAMVYNAADPIGVDDSAKEAFIDYILFSDWFAWSVLDPEFRTEWYYEIVTINPEPEIEYEQLRLCVDVWRPGMAEEEPFRCWLIYDGDWMQVSYGTDGEILTGIISRD